MCALAKVVSVSATGRRAGFLTCAALPRWISFLFSLSYILLLLLHSRSSAQPLSYLCVFVCVCLYPMRCCAYEMSDTSFLLAILFTFRLAIVVAFGAQQHWVNSSEPPNSIRRSALTSASNGTTATTDRCYRLNFDAYNCGIYHIHGSIGCLLYGMT